MNYSSIINKINKEYAELLFNITKDVQVVDPKLSLTQLADLCQSSDLSILDNNWGQLNPAQYHLFRIFEELQNFWDQDKISIYKNAAMQVESSKVHTVLSHIYLLTFYDTIIYKYVAHWASNEVMKNWEKNSEYIKSLISGYALDIREQIKLLPLLQTEYEPPLLVFDLGDLNEQININSLQLNFSLIDKTVDYQINILKELTRTNFKYNSLNKWSDFINKSRYIDLDLVFYIDKLRDVLQYGWRKEAPKRVIEAFELDEFMSGKRKVIHSSTFALIFQCLGQYTMDLLEHDRASIIYNADSDVQWSGMYKVKLGLESKRLADRIKLPTETAIPYILSLKDFNWIHNLDLNDLVLLRESEDNKIFRKIFYDNLFKIKSASLEKGADIALEINNELNRLITEENKKFSLDKAILKKKLRKTSLSFSATISLSIISIIAPPVLFLTIPLGMWSTFIGSASAKDVVHEILENKRQTSLVKKRPTSIISKILNREDK